MNNEKIPIIFFRSEKKFVPPHKRQFPFKEQDIELMTIDIGDTYGAICLNISKIIETINIIVRKDIEEIYLCGACPNSFPWHLRKILQEYFPNLNFIWLQMPRRKEEAYDLKQYEIWPDFKI